MTYDTTNNRLILDWTPPVPTAGTWLQGMASMTAAATSNNQDYGIAFGVDGAVEPTLQSRLIRENPNDNETVLLHGHRQVPNITSLSVFVKNSTSTAALAISNLNFRFYGQDNG